MFAAEFFQLYSMKNNQKMEMMMKKKKKEEKKKNVNFTFVSVSKSLLLIEREYSILYLRCAACECDEMKCYSKHESINSKRNR